MSELLTYFFTGGIVTVAIVSLEESGSRVLSGFATLVPIFTVIAYLFIGQAQGGVALSQHAQMVLVGTLVAWVPYMLCLIFLAPHMSTYRTMGIALGTFFVLVTIFLGLTKYFGWFQ